MLKYNVGNIINSFNDFTSPMTKKSLLVTEKTFVRQLGVRVKYIDCVKEIHYLSLSKITTCTTSFLDIGIISLKDVLVLNIGVLMSLFLNRIDMHTPL